MQKLLKFHVKVKNNPKAYRTIKKQVNQLLLFIHCVNIPRKESLTSNSSSFHLQPLPTPEPNAPYSVSSLSLQMGGHQILSYQCHRILIPKFIMILPGESLKMKR